MSFATVASDFDVNGDGVDDILVGDPFGGSLIGYDGEPLGLWETPHGAAYIVYGRQAGSAEGLGAIAEAIEVRVGSRVRYEITGLLRNSEDLNADFVVKPASTQFELLPHTNLQSVNEEDLVASDSADLNEDGAVDFADFLLLSANFGRDDDNVGRSDGDLDGNGVVEFPDFLPFSSQYGLRAQN